MLTVISDELAIDLEKVVIIRKDSGSWSVETEDTLHFIRDFERIRIWEILGEKASQRYRKDCDCA